VSAQGSLNNFVFRGLLTSEAVRELQNRGLLRPRTASTEERKEHDLFAPVLELIRNSSVQMQRYFRILFVFENLIRDFVTARFVEADGEDWFDKRATADMKRKVEARKQSEERNHWHIGRNDHPVYYIDFSDLGLLIINHWDLFKDFFPNQAWVTSRVQEGERTRNVIAHTNVLAAAEGARLEMFFATGYRKQVETACGLTIGLGGTRRTAPLTHDVRRKLYTIAETAAGRKEVRS
jgi:hypothetical protein